MILLCVLAVIIFPLYSFMNYTYFPITAHTCATDQTINAFRPADEEVDIIPESTCLKKELELELRVGFQIFVLTMMVFVGWCLLCIFLPTGMQAYPFDLVAQWVERPRPKD